MKKFGLGRQILAIVLIACMMCSMMACGSDKKNTESTDIKQSEQESGNAGKDESESKDKDDNKDESEKQDTQSTENDATESTQGNNGSASNGGTTGSNNGNGGTNGTTGGNTGNNNGNSTGDNNSNGGGSVASGETDFGVAAPTGTLTTTSRVSVHDPSIEYDPLTKKWYIFGSHTAFASSSDLIKWSQFEYENATSQTKYGQIFKKAGEWAALGSSSYDIKGNLWAPDVIYNKDMGKWCMYMSVNGNNYYSSIAMATADSVTGPYTYVGTVVFSGFTNSTEAAKTDYAKVTGSNNVASRYTGGGSAWDASYGTNAIDPCVLYDKDGQLWMVYGSWFGGLFMLKLDNATGLRDYSYTYALDTNASDNTASDPYLGIRVSGGYGGTGEGPYIVWDEEAGYYYMYVSYCGLEATTNFAGYQMRLFRSKNITGPYEDASGNYAIRKSAGDDQSVKGIKIMGNYFFSSLSSAEAATGSQSGYKSPGHNSAIVDNAGNRYVIYHTRFNKGSEWHQIRVHQQFLNEDGWLVTAPYEYLGSKISTTGYSEADIVGEYELINHGNDMSMAPGMLSTGVLELQADHTISGDYTGTWSQKSGTCYATITIGGVTYKGVFFKQFDESSSHKETMTFSVIGSNNIALWGSRTGAISTTTETGKQVASYTFDNTGSLGADSIGTIGNATINGCTSYNDATRGKVLAFDGVDDYVQLSSKATNYSSYTIMMWFKPTQVSYWRRVFDLGASQNSSMFFTIYSEAATSRFAQQINGDGEKQIQGPAITANQWTHVALTVSSSSEKATLYINGTRVGSTTLSALPKNYSGSANYLGKSQYPDDLFAGYMDNVFLFDYALSANEITTYMAK